MVDCKQLIPFPRATGAEVLAAHCPCQAYVEGVTGSCSGWNKTRLEKLRVFPGCPKGELWHCVHTMRTAETFARKTKRTQNEPP